MLYAGDDGDDEEKYQQIIAKTTINQILSRHVVLGSPWWTMIEAAW
jgi:hypothetical protein